MSASAAGTRPPRSRADLLALAAGALVAAVLLARTVGLVRGPLLAARSERLFSDWAFGARGAALLDALAAIEPSLPEGAAVLVDAPTRRTDWARAIAFYALPRQAVVVAQAAESRGSPPGRRPEVIAGVRAARIDAGARAADAPPGIAGARDLLGIALAAAAGWFFLRRRDEPAPLAEEICLAAWTGLALAVPLLFLIGLAGLPLTAPAFAAVALALAAGGAAFRPRPPAPLLAGAGRRVPLLQALTWAALLLVAWKVARAPIWCWDHHAVWGLKARRILTDGFLDRVFLATSSVLSNPDYPVGLPLSWRAVTLGARPSAIDFKLCHLFFAVSVVLLTRRAVRGAGAGERIAAAAAAFVAVSPLLWDTESLGIAEIALCAEALAAICLRLENSAPPWVAGAVLGFLPWIKKEGLPLGLALLAADRLLVRRRRGALLPAAAAFALLAAAAFLVERRLLPPGLSFFQGNWAWRIGQRLPRVGYLFASLGRELLRWDWIGFWIAAAAALGVALRRRARASLALFAVVLAQTALYAFTYLATYLNPFAHVRASFDRVMAALLPLAAVAIGMLARGVSPELLNSSPGSSGALPRKARISGPIPTPEGGSSQQRVQEFRTDPEDRRQKGG